MAVISSLGVGSGLDLKAIVNGLVDAERVPAEKRLEEKKVNYTTELSAFGTLRSSLSLFQGSLSSLKLASTYNAKETTLSDDAVFSTSVASNADIGSYAVEVTALAKSHSLATNADTPFADINDTVGSGTLSISFGRTEEEPYAFTPDTAQAVQNIIVSEENGNTTLSGLRDYINSNDYGVQASIVNDGNGNRLVLSSDKTGANNSMQITVTDADGDNVDNAGLSQLAFNTGAQSSLTQTVAAQDSALSINGLGITRDTNTVTGVIDGVTLNLQKADVGNIVSVDVTNNPDEAKSAIQEFVDGYNGLITNINSLSNFDAETGESGILQGDSTVRTIVNQLRSVMTNTVSQVSAGINSITDLGIRTQSDGTLDINETQLDKAIADNASEIEALFTRKGSVSGP